MKKLLLALGAMGAISAPILSVISCGDDETEAQIDGLIHNQDGKVVIAIGENILPDQLSTASIKRAYYKLSTIGDLATLTHVEIVMTKKLAQMIHGVSFHATFNQGDAKDEEKFIATFLNSQPTTVNDIKTGLYSRGGSSLGPINAPGHSGIVPTPTSTTTTTTSGSTTTTHTSTPVVGVGHPSNISILDLQSEINKFVDTTSTFTRAELGAKIGSKTTMTFANLGITLPPTLSAGIVPIFKVAPFYSSGLLKVTVILTKPGFAVTNAVGSFNITPKDGIAPPLPTPTPTLTSGSGSTGGGSLTSGTGTSGTGVITGSGSSSTGGAHSTVVDLSSEASKLHDLVSTKLEATLISDITSLSTVTEADLGITLPTLSTGVSAALTIAPSYAGGQITVNYTLTKTGATTFSHNSGSFMVTPKAAAVVIPGSGTGTLTPTPGTPAPGTPAPASGSGSSGTSTSGTGSSGGTLPLATATPVDLSAEVAKLHDLTSTKLEATLISDIASLTTVTDANLGITLPILSTGVSVSSMTIASGYAGGQITVNYTLAKATASSVSHNTGSFKVTPKAAPVVVPGSGSGTGTSTSGSGSTGGTGTGTLTPTPGTPAPGTPAPAVVAPLDLSADLALFADTTSTLFTSQLVSGISSKTTVTAADLGITPAVLSSGTTAALTIASGYASGDITVTVNLTHGSDAVTNNSKTFKVTPKAPVSLATDLALITDATSTSLESAIQTALGSKTTGFTEADLGITLPALSSGVSASLSLASAYTSGVVDVTVTLSKGTDEVTNNTKVIHITPKTPPVATITTTALTAALNSVQSSYQSTNNETQFTTLVGSWTNGQSVTQTDLATLGIGWTTITPPAGMDLTFVVSKTLFGGAIHVKAIMSETGNASNKVEKEMNIFATETQASIDSSVFMLPSHLISTLPDATLSANLGSLVAGDAVDPTKLGIHPNWFSVPNDMTMTFEVKTPWVADATKHEAIITATLASKANPAVKKSKDIKVTPSDVVNLLAWQNSIGIIQLVSTMSSAQLQTLTTGTVLSEGQIGISGNEIYGVAHRFDDKKVKFTFELMQPFTGSGPMYINVKIQPKDTNSPLFGKTLLNNEVPIKVWPSDASTAPAPTLSVANPNAAVFTTTLTETQMMELLMEGGTGNPREYMLIPPSALGITSIVDPSGVDTTFAFSSPYSFHQPNAYLFSIDSTTHKYAVSPPLMAPFWARATKHFNFLATTEADLQKVMSWLPMDMTSTKTEAQIKALIASGTTTGLTDAQIGIPFKWKDANNADTGLCPSDTTATFDIDPSYTSGNTISITIHLTANGHTVSKVFKAVKLS